MIAARAGTAYADRLERCIRDEIDKALDVPQLVDEVLRSLPRLARLDRSRHWVERQLDADRALGWDRALENAVARAIQRRQPRIRRETLDALRRRS